MADALPATYLVVTKLPSIDQVADRLDRDIKPSLKPEIALSRRKQGFESPRERQQNQRLTSIVATRVQWVSNIPGRLPPPWSRMLATSEEIGSISQRLRIDPI